MSETEDQERRASQRTKSKAWERRQWSAELRADERASGKEGSTCALAWEGQTAAFAEALRGHLLWAASYTCIVYKNLTLYTSVMLGEKIGFGKCYITVIQTFKTIEFLEF